MIINTQFVLSSPDVANCVRHNLPEYAFIGRSNVGKSSLINMICHNPKLAKTSQKPGKTLLINQFVTNTSEGQLTSKSWYLVDLPGYGYARAGQEQREALRTMITRYCLYRQQLTSLFVLIDCRLQPQAIDLEFITWLGENEIPFAIVFTKADKVGPEKLKLNVEAFKQTLLETWEELPPIFITSAEKKTGESELVNYIESINKQLTTK